MEAWLGLIGAVVGTALGGVIAYLTTTQQQKHERQTESRRKLLSSYEEIHQLLTAVAAQANMFNMGVLGDIGYSTPFRADIAKENPQFERLRMLIDFYAPSLSLETEKLWQQYAVIVRAVGEVILQKDRNDDWKTKTVEASTIACIEMAKQSKKLQDGLAKLAHKVVEHG